MVDDSSIRVRKKGAGRGLRKEKKKKTKVKGSKKEREKKIKLRINRIGLQLLLLLLIFLTQNPLPTYYFFYTVTLLLYYKLFLSFGGHRYYLLFSSLLWVRNAWNGDLFQLPFYCCCLAFPKTKLTTYLLTKSKKRVVRVFGVTTFVSSDEIVYLAFWGNRK